MHENLISTGTENKTKMNLIDQLIHVLIGIFLLGNQSCYKNSEATCCKKKNIWRKLTRPRLIDGLRYLTTRLQVSICIDWNCDVYTYIRSIIHYNDQGELYPLKSPHRWPHWSFPHMFSLDSVTKKNGPV